MLPGNKQDGGAGDESEKTKVAPCVAHDMETQEAEEKETKDKSWSSGMKDFHCRNKLCGEPLGKTDGKVLIIGDCMFSMTVTIMHTKCKCSSVWRRVVHD